MTEAASDNDMRARAQAVLRGLQQMSQAKPVSAVHLASFMDVKGGHESLRRRVREAVAHARKELGARICANGDGYWLARTHREWREYIDAVATKAKFQFVRMRQANEAVTDRIGEQGKLFETNPWK